MRLEQVPFPQIGRPLWARVGSSDRRTIEDAAAGYHVPPSSMSIPVSVLDIGANCGATVAHYAHLWPHADIYGIEPNWDVLQVAVKNAPNCQFQRLAVTGWDGDEGGGWYDPLADAESVRVLPDAQDGWDHVDCVTLGSWLNTHGPIDFAKVDSEGAEWDILVDSSWAPLVRNLLVELHPFGAPDPPPEPWPEGRDGPSPLLAAAIPLLEGLGFAAVPHVAHPQAVFAWR